jgi:hypothetical protein
MRGGAAGGLAGKRPAVRRIILEDGPLVKLFEDSNPEFVKAK